jgi:hypothetical protein
MANSGEGSTSGSATSGSTIAHADTGVWRPLPQSAIELGRDCLRRVRIAEVSPAQWPLVLRLAVGVNDDTLVRALVRRQLAWVERQGMSPANRVLVRAEVVDSAIHRLWHNAWNNDTTSHRTPAHDSLSREFAAQLDTMQPARALLPMRLELFDLFNEANTFDDADSAGDIAAERAVFQRRVQLQLSVTVESDSQKEQERRTGLLHGERNMMAWFSYLEQPTHERLMTYLNTRGPVGQSQFEGLVGSRAPLLRGDYWFNTSSPTPSIPQRGVVSLLVFLDTWEGRIPKQQETIWATFEKLRSLHARYPELQIVLVTQTQGKFRDQDYRAHPEQEAALLHTYLTDELKVPGVVCIIRTAYHTEAGGTAVPLASSALDAYHLDPRDVFMADPLGLVVDREGWVAETNNALTGRLIGRMFQ